MADRPLLLAVDPVTVPVPVGRLAVVADAFGNPLVLLDTTHGRYTTDDTGQVTAVE